MNKNVIIRDYIVNALNDDIRNGYQVNNKRLMNKLNYYSVTKTMFDKKVSYETKYDDVYQYEYYVNFYYK
jgi:hypothetical protein